LRPNQVGLVANFLLVTNDKNGDLIYVEAVARDIATIAKVDQPLPNSSGISSIARPMPGCRTRTFKPCRIAVTFGSLEVFRRKEAVKALDIDKRWF
jgi:hypothetical protein